MDFSRYWKPNWVLKLGAFKQDDLKPIEPILLQSFFNFGFLKILMTQLSFDAWGIQTGSFATYWANFVMKFFQLGISQDIDDPAEFRCLGRHWGIYSSSMLGLPGLPVYFPSLLPSSLVLRYLLFQYTGFTQFSTKSNSTSMKSVNAKLSGIQNAIIWGTSCKNSRAQL